MTTLDELVLAGELQLQWISIGADSHRTVTWAHTTELIDPFTYLRGGELVCTVGSTMDVPEAFERFVGAVQAAGASGICFGVGDVHSAVPAHLVELCEESGVSLLAAPFGAPFLAINEYLAQRRLEQESAALRKEGELLTEVLGLVRQHVSTQHLIDFIAKAINGRLELTAGDTLRLVGGPESATAGADVRVVESRHDDVALVWNGAGDPPSPLFMASLAQVLDVARRERDVEEDLHRERIGHLLDLVADRVANPTALDATLRSAGLDGTHLVFSVWPAGAARVLSAAALTERIVLGETPEATIAVTSQIDVVLDMAERLGVVCGYSSPVYANEAIRGLGEARAASELARQGTHSVGPEALTSLEGLLRQQPAQRLQPFVDQLIEPLVELDKRRNTDLVKTLATYLETDGSLVATARAQFLHVNTVRHRLERIAQITGRDPQVFSDRTALAIAFWAFMN